ncbi:MAG: endolytic transglycosylase MltG [Candidatus Moranbacteria bacterium]|nr:endolytic transglycosylase MltG [Candidatus Moranbacteria bacterium]
MFNKKIEKFIAVFIILSMIVGSFFYFRQQVYFSHGSYRETKIFTVKKGERNVLIASRLKEEGLITGKIYFYYYLRTHGLQNKILPGDYELSGGLTIPEIALILAEEQTKFIKVTFPEGWTSKQMAERLKANGLPGDDFLAIASNPQELAENYNFLSGDGIKNLEGYLFPDTYFFAKDATAKDIAVKLLGIFNTKITPPMKADALARGKSLNEIVIMASIIEGEVRSEEDRKIVSGIFWKRLENGKPLESCATLAYVLGTRKAQYSYADTQFDSPYNTYLHQGLPSGPISNPGLSSIEAALYPQESNYNYFLSDPETGETIFSATYEEHNENKRKYGL